MLDSFIDQYREATITRAQTTYLDMVVSTGAFRVQYQDKVEGWVKPGVQGLLVQETDHPLLWDYNDPQETVYLSQPALDPARLVTELQLAVTTVTHGWRLLERYLSLRHKLSAITLLAQNLADGSGLLLQAAPVTVAEVVRATCHQHGAITYTLPPAPSAPTALPMRVLFIGGCYVIARNFTVHAL